MTYRPTPPKNDPPRGNPLVSVCIPAYRGVAHIGAAMDSVLTQTCSDLELIVVDDHSQDGTVELVSSFSDPRVRLLRNTRNLGPGANWTRCLESARGKYIKLLPQDDLLNPRCIERQAAVLEADCDEKIALTFCSRTVIAADGRSIMKRGYGTHSSGAIAAHSVIRKCLRSGTNLIGEPGAVMFRRSLARKVGAFDASIPYVVDLDYWVRLLAHGDAHYLHDSLACFRISRSSWSVTIGRNQAGEFSRFIERIVQRPETFTRLDRVRGHVAARFNNLLRLLAYQLVIHERS